MQRKEVSKPEINNYSTKPRIRLPYRGHIPDKEKNTLPSMTIPDHSITIKKMLDRQARGLPIEGAKPVYNGQFLLPIWSKLDHQERHALIEHTKQRVQKSKELIESKKAEFERKQKEAFEAKERLKNELNSQRTFAPKDEQGEKGA